MAFCDGTGKDGEVQDEQANPTNVYRLFEQVEENAKDQRVILENQSYTILPHYFAGIGSKSKGPEKLLAQVFGMKIVNMVADVYLWIAENYQPGDHICLFGYSRGAFVARKVAGLLHSVGLTTSRPELLRQWRSREKGAPWAEKPTPSMIPIKYLGLWDTVGAIYSPLKVGELKRTLGISDEELPPNVKHALHVVAFHENRRLFRVTLFEENDQSDLQEVWFPGAHADVGGGGNVPTNNLPNISLNWMIEGVDVLKELLEPVAIDYTSVTSLAPQDAYGESPTYKQIPDRRENRLRSKLLTHSSKVHQTVKYLENAPREIPLKASLLTLKQLREEEIWNDATNLVPCPSLGGPTTEKALSLDSSARSSWFPFNIFVPPTDRDPTPSTDFIAIASRSSRHRSNHYWEILPDCKNNGWTNVLPIGGIY